jgi:hypothetical protein
MSRASQSKRSARRNNAARRDARPVRGELNFFRPRLEALEDRTLLSINLVGQPAAWSSFGPSPILGGGVEGMGDQGNPVSGAVTAIVVNPDNANVVYAATTNGGVWKTTTAADPHHRPSWSPLTDSFGSLSISALAMDPRDHDTLYAGTGVVSSRTHVGGPNLGLLKTTDGTHWKLLPTDDRLKSGLVYAIVPLDQTLAGGAVEHDVLVATPNGAFRNTAGGEAGSVWVGLSGSLLAPGNLPDGAVTSMVADPGHAGRVYAAVVGQGVYRSDDYGSHWSVVAGNGSLDGVAQASRLVLAVSPVGPTNPVYVALIAPVPGKDPASFGTLSHIYRSTSGGDSWSVMADIQTNEKPMSPDDVRQFGLLTEGQGGLHFSMAADPQSANIVYVAGDAQPDTFDGRVFRGDADQKDGTKQWELIVNLNASSTAPHADSRAMAFVPNDPADPAKGWDLLEGDDGGLHRLPHPTASGASWVPMVGNLQATEFISVAYDDVNGTFLGGAQDNGFSDTTATGNWQVVVGGDGGIVQVANVFSGTTPLYSVHYGSAQRLADFVRTTYFKGGTGSAQPVKLIVYGSGGKTLQQYEKDRGTKLPFITPYALNSIDPTNRMLIGTTSVYDGYTGGDTLYKRQDFPSEVTALVSGGWSGGVADPELAYVATDFTRNSRGYGVAPPQLWLRTTATAADGSPFKALSMEGFNGGQIRDIVLDPSDWHTVYVAAEKGVYRCVVDASGTAHWTDLTGNLTDPRGSLQSGDFQTVELVFGAPGTPDVLLVGGQGGVHRLIGPFTGPNFTWTKYGVNLPNAIVSDLHFDARDNLLVAGTVGRGVWVVSNVRATVATPSDLQVTGTDGDDTITLARDVDNPLLMDVTVAPATGSPQTQQYALAALRHISVQGLGGDDTLIADVRNGALNVPDGIDFDGGDGANELREVIDVGSVPDLAPPPTGGVVRLSKAGETQTVRYSNTTAVRYDLEIDGDLSPNTINVGRDASDPSKVDASLFLAGSFKTTQLPLAVLREIDVKGMGGDDVLNVDARNGLLTLPGGTHFDGGGGSGVVNLLFAPPAAPDPGSPPAATDGTVTLTSGPDTQALTFSHTATVLYNSSVNLPGGPPMDDRLDDGIRQFLGAGRDLLAQALPFVGTSLGSMLAGASPAEAEALEDPAEDEGGDAGGDEVPDPGDPGTSVLQRLIETGTGAFQLADIGQSITTADELRDRVDALDDVPGNVTYSDSGGVIRFDVRVTKTLSGIADLGVLTPDGKASVSGTIDALAEVSLHVIFGLDAQGFFIDTLHNPDPLLVVRNLRNDPDGGVDAVGRIGSLDVNVTAGTLQFDPQFAVAVNLRQAAPDPLTGESDGLLREDQLDAGLSSLTSTDVLGNPTADDAVFTPTLAVAPVGDGEALFDLGGAPQVTFRWADADAPGGAQVSAGNSLGQEILDFLNVSSSQLVRGLSDLAGSLQGLATLKGSLLGTSFALTGGSLGSILNGPVSNVTVATSDVAAVSPVAKENGVNKFVVSLAQGDLTASGVALGDAVTYAGLDAQGVSHTVQGVVDAIGLGQFTVHFAADLTQTPDPANRTFTIAHSGSPQHQLQAALGGLLGPAAADARAPSLQDLVLELSALTGVDPDEFGVKLSGSGDSLGVQFTLDFHPNPLTFPAGLNLGSLIPGVNLGDFGKLTATVDTELQLTAGLLLSPTLPAGRDRFYLAADGAPAVTIHFQVAPAAPLAATGTIGFLNVKLEQDSSIHNNLGLSLAGSLEVTLTDPKTEADDHRIGLAELTPPDPGSQFSVGTDPEDPLVVSIPGLLVEATIPSLNLPPIHISLDGNAGGKITSLTDLENLLTHVTVTGLDAFTDFDNLSSNTLVDALTGVATQLGVAGTGAVFGDSLPLIGNGLGTVLNLAGAFGDRIGLPKASDIPTLQDVVNFLNSKLPPGAAQVTLSNGVLGLTLSFSDDFSKSFPLSLGLGGTANSLVSAKGSGEVELKAHIDVGLSVGIDLKGGDVYDRVFFNTAGTHINVSAVADAGYDLGSGAPPALSLDVGLGPVPVVSATNVRVLLRPQLTATLKDGATPGRLKLSEVKADSATGSFSGDAQAVIPLQLLDKKAEVDVLGQIKDAGSIRFDTSDDPDPNFTPNTSNRPVDLSATPGFTVTLHNVTGLLPSLPFDPDKLDLGNILDNLDALLEPLHALLNSGALDKVKLPLIGSLGDAGKFVLDLKDKIQSALQGLQSGNPFASAAAVQQALTKGLQTLIPSGQIVVTSDADHVQFDMLIAEDFQLANVPLAADFGIPGLNIKIDPGTQFVLHLPLQFAFGFGLSKKDGLYLDTGAVDVLNAKFSPSPNLTHTLTVGLKASLEGLHATGMLASCALS